MVVARLVFIVVATVWLLSLYLVFGRWWEVGLLAKQQKTNGGWNVSDGVALWSITSDRFGRSVPTSVNRSLGEFPNRAGNGWCSTACGGPNEPPCNIRCYGIRSIPGHNPTDVSPQTHIGSNEVRPRGQPADSTEACQAICEKQSAQGIQIKCNGYQFDKVTKTCFTYGLRSFPPSNLTKDPNVTSGWPVDSFLRRSVVRETAVTALTALPIVLAVGAYQLARGPISSRVNFFPSVLVGFLAVAIWGYLTFVGFPDTDGSITTSGQCSRGNTQCRADRLVGGRNSGGCFHKCCARTLSCRIKPRVWSTCTWPNVMCADGFCAASANQCRSGHEGLLAQCDQGPGAIGAPTDGADYGPACDASNFIENSNYPGPANNTPPLDNDVNIPKPQTPDDGQYTGEPNCTPPQQAVIETGLKCLPAGITNNSFNADGSFKFNTFTMTPPLNAFLDQGVNPTSQNGNPGCGMATNDRLKRQDLFMVAAAESDFCTVPEEFNAPSLL